VRDTNGGVPLAGARVLAITGDSAVTDVSGRATVALGAYSFQAAIVLASGYGGYDLLDQDVAWGRDGRGTAAVWLTKTETISVTCTRGDAPCPPETRIAVHQAGQRSRICSLQRSGNWSCPAVEGDVVTARYFNRRVQESIPWGADAISIALPPAEREVCFDLPATEACTVVVADAGSAIRQTVRSGDAVDLGVAGTPEVGLICPSGSWYDVPIESGQECLRPLLDPPGEICTPDGLDCTVRAVDPAWDNVVRRPAPCIEGLPPGKYSVTCGDAGIVEVVVSSGEVTSAMEGPK
jgi:hypothetical protein